MAALATLCGALAAPAPAAPTPAAAPTIEIKPTQLPRGENSRVPWLVGDRVIVDGDTRIELADPGYLLGRSGTAYLVVSTGRLLRVRADGTTRRIARLSVADGPVLSGDGDRVVVNRTVRRHSRIRVLDARTGRQIVSRDFPRYTGVLDVDGGRAVLFSMAPARTLWWNFVADTTRPILRRGAGAADIGADRLSTFTGDPYQGGCTVVSSLRRPRQVLWRSCEDRPIAFSPNGRRMVTTDILSDGLGPGEVTARTTKGGKRLAAYRTYWFGAIAWETDRALLMDANTRRRAATVRCVVAECERASAVRRP
ncbi:hypothetical protein GCM10027062_08510 [Nocardioides hungaricus]